MPTPCTVTGTLQTLTSGKIAQGKVIFQLTNIGTGNPIGVSGTSIIPALTYTAMTAQDGTFTLPLWGNDNITPSNTLYAVTFRDFQGNEIGPVQYSIVGTSANLNTLAATGTVLPPVIATQLPAIVASATVLGQNASIGTTTLYAVPSTGAGIYRATVYLFTTTAGSAGTVSSAIGYNNGPSGPVTINSGSANLASLGSDCSPITNSFLFFSAASQNITYATTNTGSTGLYALRVRLEYLG
jgi:hypothetical protein